MDTVQKITQRPYFHVISHNRSNLHSVCILYMNGLLRFSYRIDGYLKGFEVCVCFFKNNLLFFLLRLDASPQILLQGVFFQYAKYLSFTGIILKYFLKHFPISTVCSLAGQISNQWLSIPYLGESLDVLLFLNYYL